MDIYELTRKATDATDFESVVGILEDVLTGYDIDYLIYYVVRSEYRGVTVGEGARLPHSIKAIEEILEPNRRFDSDAVIRRYVQRGEAFHWYDPEQDPALSDFVAEVLNRLREGGYIDGLCFPVSAGPGDLAVIGVSARGRIFDQSPDELEALRLVCALVHRRCNDLLCKDKTGLRAELSPRERETMRFVLEGLSNKEIAAELCVSTHTIDMYLRRIFQKMNVRNRVQAVVKHMLLETWRVQD